MTQQMNKNITDTAAIDRAIAAGDRMQRAAGNKVDAARYAALTAAIDVYTTRYAALDDAIDAVEAAVAAT